MKALKIIALAVLAFLVLTFVLALFSDPPVKTSSPSAPTQEPEAPDVPESGEEVASDLIPGLNPVDVYLSLENRGFTVKKDFGQGYAIWTCVQKFPSVELSADVQGPSATEVNMVRAMVMADGVEKTALAGRDFVAYVASAPYKGSQPQVAHDWVIENYDMDGATLTIGGVIFTMKAPSVLYRMLIIEPVK